ncbi:MAG: hypothetical protein IPM56_02935 [Ignavibacteriales bacterium]|nr:MAG: hypothetical protein IPM56_02935 [Ignavibacteriales bacterium]
MENEIKLKILMQCERGHILDPEEDFFELGLLRMHGLIDDDLKLTSAGERVLGDMICTQISENGTSIQI